MLVLRRRPAALLALAFCLLLVGLPPARGETEATSAPTARESGSADADSDRPGERAAWNAMFRQDAAGRVLGENRLKALADACNIPIDPSMPPNPPGGESRSAFGPSIAGKLSFPGTVWQSIGPQPIQSLTEPSRAWGNVSGRVDSIAIHPTNPSIILLGSATGGIWKSTDSGSTWRPVSDTAPALATSSIAFSASNPSIVYATTGELDKAGDESSATSSLGTYLGAGLLKSVDGGETWIRSDVDVNLPADAVLARVIVQPTNPQNVLVAIYAYFGVPSGYYFGGIYRSTDGGVHFSRTMAHLVTDLAQDPNDANTAYFAAANSNCPSCPDAGVWVSHDFGQSWAKMFPNSSPVSYVKLGVSRVTPTALYASFLNADNQHTGTGGIFSSTDAGAHWSQVSADPSMCPAPPAMNQCWYDHWIEPDPSNPQTVYFGSINLYKSVDAGTSWQKLTNNYDGTHVPVHPDQHAVAIVASSPNTVYFGNDGGVYRSMDGGSTFQNLNATLALSQFNEVVPHPQNANEAIGGTQDNGNLRFSGQSLWVDQTSGDGGFNLIRSDAPQQSLVAHYYAGMELSVDGGATYQVVTACGTLMDCTANKPLPGDPMAFYPPATAAPAAPSTVFFGTNRVWKNTTFGANSAAWMPMSSGAISAGVLTTLDTVGDGSGAFWAGGQNGDVLFSSDGGATFSARTSGLPTAVVTRIVATSADGQSAYVTFGGFLGSPSRHVFRTADAGVTWTNISSNLPDVPVTALAIDPTDPNGLYVGTDVGVFRTVNGGASWTSFSQGLPNASVYGLAFSPASGDLYAATYGRGVFRIRNSGAAPIASFTFSPASPTPGQTVQFTDTSANSPTSWSWAFGDGAIAPVQNPTHVYGTSGTFTVSLTASNAAGSDSTSMSLTVASEAVGRGHLIPLPRGATLPRISGRD